MIGFDRERITELIKMTETAYSSIEEAMYRITALLAEINCDDELLLFPEKLESIRSSLERARQKLVTDMETNRKNRAAMIALLEQTDDGTDHSYGNRS